MGTTCIPSKNLCPFLKGCKWAYLVFQRKRRAENVAMAKHGRCHSVSFVMYISGAKFEKHCSNIGIGNSTVSRGIGDK